MFLQADDKILVEVLINKYAQSTTINDIVLNGG
jgi:hypothetical protein